MKLVTFCEPFHVGNLIMYADLMSALFTLFRVWSPYSGWVGDGLVSGSNSFYIRKYRKNRVFFLCAKRTMLTTTFCQYWVILKLGFFVLERSIFKQWAQRSTWRSKKFKWPRNLPKSFLICIHEQDSTI